MNWRLSSQTDPNAVTLADRHYSRKTPGSGRFMPPGRCLVLVADRAVWGISWPYAEYAHPAWAGGWLCTIFRNESPVLSSTLIREAIAATRWRWPVTPLQGLFTMVNPSSVRPKRDPGRCFRRAGFSVVGETPGGLLILQLRPEDMPEPARPYGAQLPLDLT